MKILIAPLVLILFMGCSGIQVQSNPETSTQLAKVAIQFAVMKVVKKNPDIELEKHVAVMETMLVAGDTIGGIKTYAMNALTESDLEPEDKILINNLIDIASSSIVQVSENEHAKERAMAIEVLKWVREALILMEE